MSDLEKELTFFLNKHSIEGASNTPDYILARYLVDCLSTFSAAVNYRDEWYRVHGDDFSKISES